MGAWLLVFHIVTDGSSVVLQDRFATEQLCNAGAAQIRQDIGGDFGIRTKSHTCIYTGVGE